MRRASTRRRRDVQRRDLTGQWVIYDYDERRGVHITGGWARRRRRPRYRRPLGEEPAPGPDPGPEGEQFAELGEVPGKIPVQPEGFGPAFYELDLPDGGTTSSPIRKVGPNWSCRRARATIRCTSPSAATAGTSRATSGSAEQADVPARSTTAPTGATTQVSLTQNPDTKWFLFHQRGPATTARSSG